MADIKTHHLKADSAESYSEAGTPILSTATNYAADWYADARGEVSDSANKQNKRREIVFSVFFLESYLYEWVRNQRSDFLAKLFDKGAKTLDGKHSLQGLKFKWQYIPSAIAHELMLATDFELDLNELERLIKFRDGFVHAKASRFYNDNTEEIILPVPSQEKLANTSQSGWAVTTAKNLVISLHQKTDSDPPKYFEGRSC